MSKKEYNLKKISNSELLTRFMNSRDNVIHFRMVQFQEPNNETTNLCLELELKEYNNLKEEIYRRMK